MIYISTTCWCRAYHDRHNALVESLKTPGLEKPMLALQSCLECVQGKKDHVAYHSGRCSWLQLATKSAINITNTSLDNWINVKITNDTDDQGREEDALGVGALRLGVKHNSRCWERLKAAAFAVVVVTFAPTHALDHRPASMYKPPSRALCPSLLPQITLYQVFSLFLFPDAVFLITYWIRGTSTARRTREHWSRRRPSPSFSGLAQARMEYTYGVYSMTSRARKNRTCAVQSRGIDTYCAV